ncbi:hypothetical protein BT67DRAFT_457676 [Trichocladium antarcticum]|uniref:Uncharacterized protein n=1 Tax=Trichocladium antarcticum TaxID=1450529 RepID=A0AAN6ZC83_9PEZI|nr:hypothetical protein BT67DRAFT_457676 [Trichocladium antarcticum]
MTSSRRSSGPWQLETRITKDPGKSITLIVLVKVGTVIKNGIASVIQQVPADGNPSTRNGEAFSCLTWAKDALAHLMAKGNVVLKADVETMQEMAKKYAVKYATKAETGKGAYVVNTPTPGSQDSSSSTKSSKSTKSTRR